MGLSRTVLRYRAAGNRDQNRLREAIKPLAAQRRRFRYRRTTRWSVGKAERSNVSACSESTARRACKWRGTSAGEERLALGYCTPAEFAAAHRARHDGHAKQEAHA